jgi:hypothetical protein
MKLDDILAPGAKFEPYWWDAAPRPTLPETDAPARVDVAVVGSGFTGLVAALTLARAGREVQRCRHRRRSQSAQAGPTAGAPASDAPAWLAGSA